MLEQQLIVCTNANIIRKLLVKLASTNPAKPLWTVNPSWEIATPIKSVLMSLQSGFLQDFAYVLLGKSRELSARGVCFNEFDMISLILYIRECCNSSHDIFDDIFPLTGLYWSCFTIKCFKIRDTTS